VRSRRVPRSFLYSSTVSGVKFVDRLALGVEDVEEFAHDGVDPRGVAGLVGGAHELPVEPLVIGAGEQATAGSPGGAGVIVLVEVAARPPGNIQIAKVPAVDSATNLWSHSGAMPDSLGRGSHPEGLGTFHARPPTCPAGELLGRTLERWSARRPRASRRCG
jgi:hypothetical protein